MIATTCRKEAFVDFMVKFQSVCFADEHGCKIGKTSMFTSVWDNHVFINGDTKLDVNKDTMCQLLFAGNYPDIKTVARNVPKFNENELIEKALQSIMAQRAIVLVRDNITAETTPEQIVKLLTDAMICVFNQHENIDKDIEAMIAPI